MSSKYTPELGQFLFGNPTGRYKCPHYIIALLEALSYAIERVEWNKTQKEYEAPIKNNGGYYKTDVFEMRAYYWGDCNCEEEHEEGCPCALPNFKCGDFEVRWYKWLGRGTSMNKKISEKEMVEIFNKCIKSLKLKR